MDLMAAEDVTIFPGCRDNVLTGLCAEIPPGYELQIRSRSGLAMRGIQAHFGTIDEDYRGELKVILYNHSEEPLEINHGDRIAQAVLAPVVRAVIEEAEELSDTVRGDGGFGSSGR